MKKPPRSQPLAAIHETMVSLHQIGAIDKRTMRHFDDACLTPVAPDLSRIKADPPGNTSGLA